MTSKLNSIGLDDTIANNNKLFNHLLNDGARVTPTNREITSIIEGLKGKVKMISTWTILPNGEKYLSTVKLIPIQ